MSVDMVNGAGGVPAPAPEGDAAGAALPAWGPTGEARADDVNRFRTAMGDIGDAKPADRVWNLIETWNAEAREKIIHLSQQLGEGLEPVSITQLLHMQIQAHEVTMTQSLMAKAGATVNETTQALLRGQ